MKKIFLILILTISAYAQYPTWGARGLLNRTNTWTGANTWSDTATFGSTATFQGVVDIQNTMTLGNDAANISGNIGFVASDGDAGNILINTSDQLWFQNFGFIYVVGAGFAIEGPQKFYIDGGGDTYIWHSSSDIMRFTVGGSDMLLLIEAATDSVSIVADKLHYNQLAGGAVNLTADDNGNIIRDPSDAKFKTNIKPIDGALEKVLKLEGRSYDWIKSGKPDYGLVAQEAKDVDKTLVVEADYMSIKQNALIALLIEAIKEQQKEIDALKAKYPGWK